MRNWWKPRGGSRSNKKNRFDGYVRLGLEHLETRCTPTVSLTGTFNGLKMGDPGNDGIPPDVNGAAGPDRVVETVNSSIAIFDRSGKMLASDTGDNFFNVSGSYDPYVIFDEYAQRFVIFFDVTDGSSTSNYCIAVSNNASPSNLTSDWTEKQNIDVTATLNGTATWADFPRIGYNADAWVISFNQFGFSGGFEDVQILTIDKSTYLDQNSATHTEFKTIPGLGLFTMTATIMHEAAPGDPMYFVYANNNSGSSIDVVKMTNVLSANPNYTDSTVTVNSYAAPPTSPQPGGTSVNERDDARMRASDWRGNRLVVSHDVDAGGVPGVSWYELNTSASTPTVTQQGVIHPGAGIGAMHGTVAINPLGAIGATYMQSSATEFLSFYVTGQNPGDPAGTMQTAVLGIAGQAAYNAFDGDPFRLGDYSSVTVDPVDGSFWATNEFADNRSSDNWATGVAHFDTGLTGGGGGGGGGSSTLTATPNPVDENHPTNLQGTFSDPAGQFQTHVVTIDWGDKTAQSVFLSAGVFVYAANHTYLDNAPGTGVYSIKTKVVSGKGFTFNDGIDVRVDNLPPTAVIIGAPGGAQSEGKTIALGSKVTDPSPLDTFSYVWVVNKNGVFFANGTNGGISFTPDDQGTYDAFLSVRDDDGGTVDASPVRIFVQNAAPFASSLTNDGPKKSTEAVTISFVNPSDAAADLAAGLKYDYDFDNNGAWDLVGSTSSSAQHVYGFPGIYTAAARIEDKDGAFSQKYLTDVFVSDIAGGNGGIITKSLVATGSDAGKAALVKVFDPAGSLQYTLSPFGKTFLGGARVATGDVNGDKVEDIIVGNGAGMVSTIKVYDGSTGLELTALSTQYTQQLGKAYAATFTNGVNLAVGDINRDGFADVVVAPAKGAAPVEVINGKTGLELARITPLGSYAGGITIAIGDVTGDRIPDLIAGQATTGSKVVIQSGANLAGAAFRTIAAAFPTTFNGGVFVAAGDIDGDRRADVIVGTNASLYYDSRVRVYNGATNAVMKEFVAFAGYRGGVRVAADDLDGDGKADLIVTSGKYSTSVGAQPRVLALKGTNLSRLFDIGLIDVAFQGGVFVG
jgi:hypothetical protein